MGNGALEASGDAEARSLLGESEAPERPGASRWAAVALGACVLCGALCCAACVCAAAILHAAPSASPHLCHWGLTGGLGLRATVAARGVALRLTRGRGAKSKLEEGL